LLFFFGIFVWDRHGFKLDLARNDLYRHHIAYTSEGLPVQIAERLKSPPPVLWAFPPARSILWADTECLLWRASPGGAIYRCTGAKEDVYISSTFLAPDLQPFYISLERTHFQDLMALKSRDCTLSDLWTWQAADEFQRSFPKCYAAWRLAKLAFSEETVSISLDEGHLRALILRKSAPTAYKLIVYDKYTELFLPAASTSHNSM